MKRKGALLLSLTLALLVAVGAITVLVQAVWNEEEAVHITPSEIEDSTLAIGTHLIHLSALTNELYEIASDSADESGQTEIYYKSELSAGTWFNITTASSLEDITTGGTPVLDSEIEELFFTHHTKSDGVTYDLRTGQPVNPYDIVDPYDIETFDELLPLKNQYEIIKEMQGESAAGKEKIQKIEEVLRTEVKNAVTDECDANLAALQQYYDELAANNAPADQLDAVQEVMNAVDATRRAEVFTTLEAVLNEFTQSLPRIEDTAGTSEAEARRAERRTPSCSLPPTTASRMCRPPSSNTRARCSPRARRSCRPCGMSFPSISSATPTRGAFPPVIRTCSRSSICPISPRVSWPTRMASWLSSTTPSCRGRPMRITRACGLG